MNRIPIKKEDDTPKQGGDGAVSSVQNIPVTNQQKAKRPNEQSPSEFRGFKRIKIHSLDGPSKYVNAWNYNDDSVCVSDQKEDEVITPCAKLGIKTMTRRDKPVPQALIKCLEHIELRGIGCKDIYNVPGSKGHVDYLIDKLVEDDGRSIDEHHIPMNAVVSTVKTFLSESQFSILPSPIFYKMVSLGKMENREEKIVAWKDILDLSDYSNLSPQLINRVFLHLFRVSRYSSTNSMDSRALAKCLCPFMVRSSFIDTKKMATFSKFLEEAVFILIDGYVEIFGAN